MCLGIPGKVVEMVEDHPDLATVDVLGEKRNINTGLIEEGVVPGDWVLIHVGFAMQKINTAEAEQAMQGLVMMRGPSDGNGDDFGGDDFGGDDFGGFDEPKEVSGWAF
jgi:hydrogenase expression/formation protein HypC